MTLCLVLSLAMAGLVAPAPAVASQDSTSRGQTSTPSRPPNIVVILTDDQDALPDSMAAMPKLQELLAKQGMTFAQFFAPVALCCPARATLLLGQYSHNSRILYNTLPEGGFQHFIRQGLENTTLATALDAAGYQTALLGKYLNGYPDPDNQTHIPPGWDDWIVPVTDTAYSSYEYSLNENGTIVSYGKSAKDHITNVLTQKAISFISTTTTISPEVPFFLELSLYAPHSPAVPPPGYSNLFTDVQAPRPPSFNEGDMSDKPPFMQKLPLLDDKTIAGMDALRRNQLQSLAAADDAVAAVVKALEQSGQIDNTYIFFLSDNGLHLGEHRFATGKGSPFEEDIRVPLIVRGPGVPQDAVRHELASLVDIAPTIAELAGATMPTVVDGRSLTPLLHNTAAPKRWRNAVLIEHWKPPAGGESDTQRALEPPDDYETQLKNLKLEDPDYVGLRTASYKYVDRVGPPAELYNVAEDPYEIYSQHTDATPEFLDQLNTWLSEFKNCAGDACRSVEERPAPKFSLLYERTDMDRNEATNMIDLSLTTDCWSGKTEQPCGDRYDLNYDGRIDIADVVMEGEAIMAGLSALGASPSATEQAPGESASQGDPATRLAEAEALLEDGKAGEALAIFKGLSEQNPEDRDARMGMAAALAATGDIEQAIAVYQQIQSDWPDFASAYIRHGELLEKSGKLSAAIKEYKAAVKAAPDNADVHFILAYAHVRANQIDEAIVQFQAGLQLDPSRDGPRQTLEQLLQDK